MRKSRRAQTLFEPLIITAFVIVASACVLTYFKKNFFPSGQDDPALEASVKKWITQSRQDASLVIVGRLTNASDQIHYGAQGTGDSVTGYGYYHIAIEKVERGNYPEGQIKVNIGWYSNYSAPPVYPPFLKRDYKTGDRMRIYLFYDKEKSEYFTPAAYYTIEPLPL